MQLAICSYVFTTFVFKTFYIRMLLTSYTRLPIIDLDMDLDAFENFQDSGSEED